MIFWRLSAHNIYQGDSQWSLPRFPDGALTRAAILGLYSLTFQTLSGGRRQSTQCTADSHPVQTPEYLVGRVIEGVQCAEDDRLSVTSFSRLVSQSVRALTLASFTGTWYHTAIPACQAR